MDTIREVIDKVIKEIQAQQSYRPVELNEQLQIMNDLGFVSLDVAQLIASLEMELSVDPFSEGTPLVDVKTVGDLYQVYQSRLNGGYQLTG
jgi:acyl carrier protein